MQKCDASKGCLYKQIKHSYVGEHAFPLTGFLCTTAHVTFGARGGAGGFLLVSCLPMCEQKNKQRERVLLFKPDTALSSFRVHVGQM